MIQKEIKYTETKAINKTVLKKAYPVPCLLKIEYTSTDRIFEAGEIILLVRRVTSKNKNDEHCFKYGIIFYNPNNIGTKRVLNYSDHEYDIPDDLKEVSIEELRYAMGEV